MLNLKPLQLPPPKFTFIAPREWLPRLRMLLDAFPQDDLASTEALCCRVVGDFTTGIVLHRLLYWLTRGIRSDSAIWKSDREWYAELNLSYAQMQRVRSRLSPIIKSWVEKAEGSPTYHYQLRIEALVQGIATILNRSTVEVKLAILDKVENGFSAELRMDFRQSRESLTNQPQTINHMDERLKIFHPYLKRFVGFTSEISAKLAAEYARLGDVIAHDVIERCNRSNGRSWQYVLRSLENASAPVRTPIPLYDPTPHEQDTPSDEITDEMRRAWASGDEGRAWAARLDSAKHPQPAAPAKVAGKHATDWDKAYSQLELQLDRASFDTWLRSAHFLKYENGVFQIGVPSNYARDMLQHRLYRDICRVLSNVVGTPVELQFEVYKTAAQREEDELPIFKLLALQEEAHKAEMTFYRKYGGDNG